MTRNSFDSAVTDFTQALGLLIRRARAAAASHQLSLTESAVLARLAKDGPATTADLARAEAMKPQSMGATIAALEERGFVERKPHPTDGRRIYIGLTAKGDAIRASLYEAKRTWLAEAIADLEDQERETLFRSGEIMKRLAEREGALK